MVDFHPQLYTLAYNGNLCQFVIKSWAPVYAISTIMARSFDIAHDHARRLSLVQSTPCGEMQSNKALKAMPER